MLPSFDLLIRGGNKVAIVCVIACSVASMSAQKNPVGAAATPAVQDGGTQPGGYYGPQPASECLDLSVYERIRTEGLTHGHAMDFASALSDGIGPRLTGSPNMKKANEWTRDTLARIGLENAHLEDWGEFGMGWYQINTWGRMITPDTEPIWMQAAVWSEATNGPVTGAVVYLPLADAAELDAVKGTLRGKMLMLGAPRPMPDLKSATFLSIHR